MRVLSQFSSRVRRSSLRSFSSSSKDNDVDAFSGGGLKGYNLALFRVSSMISGITETQPTKMLQIHCGDKLVENIFKTSANIELHGCCDDASVIESTRAIKQYVAAELIDTQKPLPYRSASFQFVTNLYPPSRSDGACVPISEISRLLTGKGFAVVGGRQAVWDSIGIDFTLEEAIERLSSVERLSILSLQQIPLEDPESSVYTVALFRQE